jgi:hypothetical protein
MYRGGVFFGFRTQSITGRTLRLLRAEQEGLCGGGHRVSKINYTSCVYMSISLSSGCGNNDVHDSAFFYIKITQGDSAVREPHFEEGRNWHVEIEVEQRKEKTRVELHESNEEIG